MIIFRDHAGAVREPPLRSGVAEGVARGNAVANDHAAGAKDVSPLPSGRPAKGTSRTIGSIVRGFKIGVTKWMHRDSRIHRVWQRNYDEHIIRSEDELNRVREYVANNPARWEWDRENPNVFAGAGFNPEPEMS